jgi:hypothetical protein
MAKTAETVQYETDSGEWAYALVRSTNQDGSLNLLVCNPDDATWNAANEVPADSPRVR